MKKTLFLPNNKTEDDMNIRIGDIVRFISDKLEGKVTGIIDNNTVNVYCDEYGFEIPASVNNLVVIHSDSNTTKTASATSISGQKNVVMESADTLYIAFVPENFNNLTESRFDIYLVNDTAQTSLYSISFHDGEKYTGITAGNCNPNTTYLIGNYSLKEIDTIKAIHVQSVFYQKGNHELNNANDTLNKGYSGKFVQGGSLQTYPLVQCHLTTPTTGQGIHPQRRRVRNHSGTIFTKNAP